MQTLLNSLQVGSGILLVVSILLQHRGTGIGGAFGGQDMSYRSRRGIEKLLLRLTILLTAIFLVTATVQLFV